MTIEEIKESAYTAIDRLLIGLQSGTIDCLEGVDSGIAHKQWCHYFKQIVDRHSLIGYKHWDHELTTGIITLAEGGINVLEVGGIRQYLLSYDSNVRGKPGGNPPTQPAPVTQTIINNIGGSVGNLQNNTGTIGTSEQSNTLASSAEGPWTRANVIIAIVACLVTILGVYYAWLALHPGK